MTTWRVALLYTALTIVLAYPLSIHPAGSVLSPSPDTNLFLWTLQWDVHALTHQPWAIFDANIYYPEHRTLAYSENLIGSAPFAAPILWLTGNAVLAMNLVVLMACVLCGLGGYLLARRIGVHSPGATLSGLIFAFSPARFLRLDQFHLATIEWVPFSLASLHAYWSGGRKRDLRIAAGFFTLQALSSGHGAVFLILAIGVLVCCRVARGEASIGAGPLRDLGLPGFLLLLPTALILVPYRAVQQEMGLRRSLENWAVPWSSFLASSTHVHGFLYSLAPAWRINETLGPQLFPGWIPLILAGCALAWRRDCASLKRDRSRRWSYLAWAFDIAAIAGIVAGAVASLMDVTKVTVGDVVVLSIRQVWRPWVLAGLAVAGRAAIARRVPFRPWAPFARWRVQVPVRAEMNPRHAALPYAVVMILSLWLALGPPIGLWPLVYWLPGLNFIRAPSRFVLLMVLGLGILAGIGFERLTIGMAPRRRGLLATLIGALLVAEFAAAPLEIAAYRPEPPAIDRWLATRPRPFVVAEVPLGDPGNLGEWERRESGFMLHSAAHWQKTVHGYSGLRPPLHEILYARLTTFPDAESLKSLLDLGVTYVVVHTDLYPPGEWEKIAARIDQFKASMKLEDIEGDGRVYSLTARSLIR